VIALILAILLSAAGPRTQSPSAKVMFYDPGDLGSTPSTPALAGLRPVRFAQPFLHCGIHYWLETSDGAPVTEGAASRMRGRFTLHIRNNIGSGFLTVWDVSGTGRELTPKDGQWSGYRMTDAVYVLPGQFEFTAGDGGADLVIVWARSQTEVAYTAARARARVGEMSGWMRDREPLIVRETEDMRAGEVGTYVVNRSDAGVVAEIVFRSRG